MKSSHVCASEYPLFSYDRFSIRLSEEPVKEEIRVLKNGNKISDNL
jgi:hypothetical protein